MKKTVLITGASRGIGFEIAKSLMSSFDQMILVAKHKDTLNKAALQLKCPKLYKYVVDLENQKQVLEFAKEINKKFSSLDLLVNNAGVYIGKRFDKQPLSEINKILNLNLESLLVLTHELLDLLKKGKASQVVNISSYAVNVNIYGEAVYTATKAAVSAFSSVLRKELNSEGIRITSIQPFGVDTYPVPQPDSLLNPQEIGAIIKYIVGRPPAVQIETVELSHINQWRGDKPSWIE